MNSNWWRSFEELDDDQKAFISLPLDGKHSLEGPPGSGKTNLLLLRAEYLAGRGEKNVLILTFTKTLRNFIRSGIGERKLISPTQVMTYHAWARAHILHHLNVRMVVQGAVFDDATRVQIVENLRNANAQLDSPNKYSAIFVDEAQDLSIDELELLLILSERVCICGDSKQGIYHQDGLRVTAKLQLQPHVLRRHFRIGRRIAQVADRLLPPTTGKMSMEDTSNYDKSKYGEARADLHHCESRNEQFDKMLGTIRLQLDAYDGETIGIFGCKNETLTELRERFDESDLASKVCFHGAHGENNFDGTHRIHVMTSHAAKGTEFRAVHLYGAEEYAKHPFNRTRLAYTVVTRAKTALDAYVTGETSKALESAFAQEAHFDPADLFKQ
jgi:superfamily I DNA/RNA helicase